MDPAKRQQLAERCGLSSSCETKPEPRREPRPGTEAKLGPTPPTRAEWQQKSRPGGETLAIKAGELHDQLGSDDEAGTE